jgi:hypothetical protein
MLIELKGWRLNPRFPSLFVTFIYCPKTHGAPTSTDSPAVSCSLIHQILQSSQNVRKRNESG